MRSGKRLSRVVQWTQQQRPAAGRTPVGLDGREFDEGSWGAGCGDDVGRADLHRRLAPARGCADAVRV
jgi:hypothetical protein